MTSRLRRGLSLAAAALVVGAGLSALAAPAAAQENYVPISGAGSTWSQNALDQWRRNVTKFGMRVNYQGTGSSDGRNQFRNGTVDFAVSEIPYGLSDGGVVDQPPARKYAYMPIVAGGTSFMYNLKIGGRKVTNLRLSGPVLAKMFTGQITRWDDAEIAEDNPGLTLPARQVVPVVRSDGSGTTAQFSTWLAKRHGGTWDAYCQEVAGRRCGTTSNFPIKNGKGFVAQSGSLGVAGYVSQEQNEGTITYVEYSYALNTGYPVAKVLNDAGYYVEPTASNVAVALLEARINEDESSPAYLTSVLDGVYANKDPRSYQLSSYSYMVLPTKVEQTFNTQKGKTLGDFAYYFLCEGQQQAPALGFSPLPLNLVQAGLDQVRKIPGIDAQTVDLSKCNNPTFSASGENLLAKNAPQPDPSDKKGATQNTEGTGGAEQPTPVAPAAAPSSSAPAAAGAAGTPDAGATGGGTGVAPAPSLAPLAAGTPGTVVDPVTGQVVPAAGNVVDPTTGEVVAGVVDPATGEVVVGGTIDPDTGAVVRANGTTSTALGGQQVVAVPVSLSRGGLGGAGAGLMALAVLVLVAVTLLPPVLSRRLRGPDAR